MSNKTAMQLHDEARDEIEGRLFEQVAESFFKRWAPSDPYEQAHFHAEFHSLVRRIYRDAQEPLFKQLTQIYRAMPLFPAPIAAPSAGEEVRDGEER